MKSYAEMTEQEQWEIAAQVWFNPTRLVWQKKSNSGRHKRDPHWHYKERIRSILNWAIEQGWLVRPDRCQFCGRVTGTISNPITKSRVRIEAHHWSYEVEHILHVHWVCQKCHVVRDREDHGIVRGVKKGLKANANQNVEEERVKLEEDRRKEESLRERRLLTSLVLDRVQAQVLAELPQVVEGLVRAIKDKRARGEDPSTCDSLGGGDQGERSSGNPPVGLRGLVGEADQPRHTGGFA